MIVLGIDPGIATTGYGVVRKENSVNLRLDSGLILTSKDKEPEERLATIYSELSELIVKHKPDCCVVEQLFFNTNTTTAISVGQARGTILLAANHNNLKCYEYTPLQVKQAVVGYGRADKQQVQYMVRQLLKINDKMIDDESDALAIAICHIHSYKFAEKSSR